VQVLVRESNIDDERRLFAPYEFDELRYIVGIDLRRFDWIFDLSRDGLALGFGA